MPKIEIYYKDYCPYCHRAIDLLDSKGVAFEKYDITNDAEKEAEMKTRKPGARTVPQIFIDDTSIGGCDDIMALDNKGDLDGKLGLS